MGGIRRWIWDDTGTVLKIGRGDFPPTIIKSKEIIVNNVTGILVDDYKSLVITVSSLLKNSDIDIEKMVFNAYQDAVKRFSSKGFSQEYKVCLEKILNDSSCHQ